MKQETVTIYQKAVARLEHHGLGIPDGVKVLGFQRSSIAHWRTAKIPTAPVLHRLGILLGIPAERLVSGSLEEVVEYPAPIPGHIQALAVIGDNMFDRETVWVMPYEKAMQAISDFVGAKIDNQ